MKKNFYRGFTLMEIMIVISIMGILVLLVTGNLTSSMRKGRDVKRKSDITSIAKSLEMYYNDVGSYPLGSGGLISGCTSSTGVLGTCAWGEAFQNVQSDVIYMPKLPTDPNSGQTYYYDSTDGKYFQIYTRLENVNDPNLTCVGNYPEVYTGTVCSGTAIECNFGASSTNTVVVTNHALETDAHHPAQKCN